MLNKEDFFKKLCEQLSERMGTEVITESFTKNNNTTYTALRMKELRAVSPNLNADALYERYCNSDENIINKIAEVAYEYLSKDCSNIKDKIGNLKDFSEIRGKVTVRLVNFDRNKEYLKEHIWMPFMDLAIIFYIVVECVDEYVSSIPVDRRMFAVWDIDINVLYEQALLNTRRIFPMKSTSMADTITNLLSRLDNSSESSVDLTNAIMDSQDDDPLYIISNIRDINGAACMLYPEFNDFILMLMAHLNSSGVYILPCSIHELIIMPAQSSDITANLDEELQEIVQSVNQEAVAEEEYLSSSVYFSDGLDVICLEKRLN